MSAWRSKDEVDQAVGAMRSKGWSRNAIHEALVEGGLTYDQATDVVDGTSPTITVVPPLPRDPTVPPPLPADAGPVGIGGWLIVPMIVLLLAPIQQAIDLVGILRALGSPELADLDQRFPGMAQLALAHGLGIAALLVMLLVAGVLFFRKKRAAPRVIIALLVLHFLVTFGYQTWRGLIDHTEQFDANTLVIIPLVRLTGVNPAFISFVAAGIWSAYFMTSKRVKNTFVR